MSIAQKHLDARKPNALGVIIEAVPGHGGDVWYVDQRTGKDAPYAVYSVMEMDELFSHGQRVRLVKELGQRDVGALGVVVDNNSGNNMIRVRFDGSIVPVPCAVNCFAAEEERTNRTGHGRRAGERSFHLLPGEEMKRKQVNLTLSQEQFDKLDTLCMQKQITKQEFGVRAYKLLFMLLKGSYTVVDKNGNKVEIL